MKTNTVLTSLLLLLTLSFSAATAQPVAPSFTISAPNITMPSSGTGAVNFTLTSVGGFAGTVVVTCEAPNVNANVLLPFVYSGGPLDAYSLTANATTTGNLDIVATPLEPSPPRRISHPAKIQWSGHWPACSCSASDFAAENRSAARTSCWPSAC